LPYENFNLALSLPASWVSFAQNRANDSNYFTTESTAALAESTTAEAAESTTAATESTTAGTVAVESAEGVLSPSLLQATKPRIANANKTFFILF
jgi:hypothetical protein